MPKRKKSKQAKISKRAKLLTFKEYIKQLDDGDKSRCDWMSRPIVSLEPIYKNVYIANFAASKKMIQINKNNNFAIVNVESNLKIDDPKVDNSISIEDSMKVDQKDFNKFSKNVAKRIEELSKKNDYVIVNCKAGINRASASVISWMTQYQNLPYNKSLKILREKKAIAAKHFRFKNRYQSFDSTSSTFDKFSWPALYGDSSKKLIEAIQYHI